MKKRVSLLAGIVALAAVPLMGLPAWAAVCQNASGAAQVALLYNNTTDCTLDTVLGPLEFFNFNFAPSAGLVVNGVSTVTAAGEFGFSFGFSGGNTGADLGVTFGVRGINGFLISDVLLGIVTDGPGVAFLTDTLFPGGKFEVDSTVPFQIFPIDPPVAQTFVIKDLAIGVGGGASAILNAFSVTAVPGPIVGAGLPGLVAACGGLLALARRRRQKFA